MKKRNKKKMADINYLNNTEKNSSLKWHTDLKERVILEVENSGIMNKNCAQNLFNKPRFTKVDLDANGSFIWPLIDGKRTVADIAVLVKEQFGEAAEPLYPRDDRNISRIVEKAIHFIRFVECAERWAE